jgi:RecJ-like exonuclease
MLPCPTCHGCGSSEHVRCRRCKGTGELNRACDECGDRIASVDVGGVYLCELCYEIRMENEREEEEQ